MNWFQTKEAFKFITLAMMISFELARTLTPFYEYPSSTYYSIDADRYRYDIDGVVSILIGIDKIICASRVGTYKTRTINFRHF